MCVKKCITINIKTELISIFNDKLLISSNNIFYRYSDLAKFYYPLKPSQNKINQKI